MGWRLPFRMKIFYHPRFKKNYQRLQTAVQTEAEKREAIFRDNPFDPRLDTHKLHGKLKKHWSFSVGRKCRILFEFYGDDVIFLDVGSHYLYK